MKSERRSEEQGAGQPADAQAFHRQFVDLLSQLDDDQIVALGHELLPQLSSPQLQRNFLENLTGGVNMSLDQGDVEAAERLLHLTRTVAEALGDAWGRTEYHYWRGRLEVDRGRPEAAIPHFEEATQGAEETTKRLMALHSVAMAWFQAGNLKEADRRFRETVEIAQAHGEDLARAHGYLGRAQVARERNQTDAALDWLEKARWAAERAGAPGLAATIAGEEGLLHAREQRLDAAGARYEDFEEGLSQGLIGMSGDERTRGEAALAANKAALAFREGRFDEARQFAEQALTSQSLIPPTEQVDNLSVVGGIAIATGDVEGAKRHLLSGFRLAGEVDYPKGRLETGLGLSMVYALQGYYEPAHRVCSGAIEGLERMRSRIGGEIERLGYVQDKMDAYRLMVQLCLILDDLKDRRAYRQQALNYVERAKSRTFIEALGPTVHLAPPPDLPAELQQTEEDLLAKLEELEKETRIYSSRDADLKHLYGEVQDELDALWEKIATVAPEYAALRRGAPATFTEIRTLLEP